LLTCSITSSTSLEIRSLLQRLQRLETTVAHLAGTATEITEQREAAVAATHQQIVNNHELLQQVCTVYRWFSSFSYTRLEVIFF